MSDDFCWGTHELSIRTCWWGGLLLSGPRPEGDIHHDMWCGSTPANCLISCKILCTWHCQQAQSHYLRKSFILEIADKPRLELNRFVLFLGYFMRLHQLQITNCRMEYNRMIMISAYVLMTTLPPRHFAGGTREHPAQPVHHSVSNQAPLERQSHASQPFQQVWTITQSTQHKDASKQHVVTDKRLHMFTLFCQLRYSTCAGLP
jgi:hypothetical protein